MDSLTLVKGYEQSVVPEDLTLYFTPENGTYTVDHVVTFGWCHLEGVKVYLLQVDDDTDFSSPEIELILTETQFTSIHPLLDGTYYWRVKAKDNYGSWSVWSDKNEMKIDTVPPISPIEMLC